MIVADTSAFVALADPEDAAHVRAKKALDAATRAGTVMVSNHVFDETVTMLRRRIGHQRAVEVGRRIRASTLIRLVRVEAEDEEAAWELFEASDKVKVSLTDCISIVWARRLRAAAIWTYDGDFRASGCTTLE